MCWVTAAMKSVGESAAKLPPCFLFMRGRVEDTAGTRLEVHLRRRERVAQGCSGQSARGSSRSSWPTRRERCRLKPKCCQESSISARSRGQKLLVYQESDHPAAEHLVDMVREGSAEGDLPSRSDLRRELEVSPRTLARDLDFLRDEERAPIEDDARAHGYRLTDETYRLSPVRLSRMEAFSFALVQSFWPSSRARPLTWDMRSVLAKIAESLEGEISMEPEWLGGHVNVLA